MCGCGNSHSVTTSYTLLLVVVVVRLLLLLLLFFDTVRHQPEFIYLHSSIISSNVWPHHLLTSYGTLSYNYHFQQLQLCGHNCSLSSWCCRTLYFFMNYRIIFFFFLQLHQVNTSHMKHSNNKNSFPINHFPLKLHLQHV